MAGASRGSTDTIEDRRSRFCDSRAVLLIRLVLVYTTVCRNHVRVWSYYSHVRDARVSAWVRARVHSTSRPMTSWVESGVPRAYPSSGTRFRLAKDFFWGQGEHYTNWVSCLSIGRIACRPGCISIYNSEKNESPIYNNGKLFFQI